jgi:GTP-binding protein HflX
LKLDTRGSGARPGREKAVLLGLHLPRDPKTYDAPLEELARLADTAGVDVLDRVVQNRPKADASTWIGSGKAAEVGTLAKGLGADLVIVDSDLAPAQSRNLEKLMDMRVVDRTELILDIFAVRARPSPAQVELAQMSTPCRASAAVDPQPRGGVGQGGAGLCGPGERQLEIDCRPCAPARDLRRDLETCRRWRAPRRGPRQVLQHRAVGYKNAGRARSCAASPARRSPSRTACSRRSTHDPRLGRPQDRRVFLSDTVGLSDLPHHLVASFLTTLEEARRADLLLHVIDSGDPDALAHVEVVAETLSRIGAGGVPRVAILNQVDRVTDPFGLRVLTERLPGAIPVSAITGQGLDLLAEAVIEASSRRTSDVVVEADPGNGRLLARLREWGEVKEITFPDGLARVAMRLAPRHFDNVRREGGRLLDEEGQPIPETDRFGKPKPTA